METNASNNPSNCVNIFSEDFISESIINHFKGLGHKVHEEVNAITDHKIVIATTFFSKEIIEIKGSPFLFKINNETSRTSPKQHTRSWFGEVLLSSFLNFGRFYQNENVSMAIALPNTAKYKAIIEGVHDYFSFNNLSFKVYLVNEDGAVVVIDLNQTTVTPKA